MESRPRGKRIGTPTLLEIERRRRGWSQTELGRRAGVHPTTISLLEQRRYLPGAATLAKLSIALGVRAGAAETLLDEIEIAETEAGRAAAR